MSKLFDEKDAIFDDMRARKRPLARRCAVLGTMLGLVATLNHLQHAWERHGGEATQRRYLKEGVDELLHYPDGLSPKHGVVVLYLMGVLYMFLALALVCDEFFVPTLEFMCHRFKIPQDVAGATFMAAGGSAPELATSFLGLFVSESNVGIGTIVGSAAFNILFVIGVCALVTPELLVLTWFPLARDCTFYVISLVLLAVFFAGENIEWYESVVLLWMYLLYVAVMFYNGSLREWAERKVNFLTERWRQNREEPSSEADVERDASILEAAKDTEMVRLNNIFKAAVLKVLLKQAHNPSRRFKCAADILVLQKKLREGGYEIGELEGVLEEICAQGNGVDVELAKQQGGWMEPGCAEQCASSHDERNDAKQSAGVCADEKEGGKSTGRGSSEQSSSNSGISDVSSTPSGEDLAGYSVCGDYLSSFRRPESQVSAEWPPGEFVHLRSSRVPTEIISAASFDAGDPMDLSWPNYQGFWGKVWYLVKLPICVPLYYTLADVREDTARVYFAWTFFGSIVWVAVFSYMMVWWTTVIGVYMNLSTTLLGMTLLAAGTSIPDLITSAIVARKGYGDMALSSSIGSNLFDITIGLPLPWLIYTIVHGGRAVVVDDTALGWQVGTLVLMVLCTILGIALHRWRLTYVLGVTLLLLYGLYIAQAFIIEFVWTPPF